MTVHELTHTMPGKELSEWVAHDRLTAAEHKKARETAERKNKWRNKWRK